MVPILYTFRRCPYAIRARLALAYAGIRVEAREVDLRRLPAAMLALSPKGTVPVLQVSSHEVLEESLDIMHWALLQSDPDGWLDFEPDRLDEINDLIRINDHSFKADLDRYKYWERYPESTQGEYREQCRYFLDGLEQRLRRSRFLFADRVSLADFALFPFVRQFARVDFEWFRNSRYLYLIHWLAYHEESQLFAAVMAKQAVWQPGVGASPNTAASG